MTIDVTMFTWTLTIDPANAQKAGRAVSDYLERVPGGLTATLADVDAETFRRAVSKRVGNHAGRIITVGATSMGMLSFIIGAFNAVLALAPTTPISGLATFWSYLMWSVNGLGTAIRLSETDIHSWSLIMAQALGESISGQEVGY